MEIVKTILALSNTLKLVTVAEGVETEAERQVLELIGVGCTYREISERLFISASTVKTHAHSALRKLGLRNRVEAMIAEGMPIEDVQRLCDVHVTVFKEALEEK